MYKFEHVQGIEWGQGGEGVCLCSEVSCPGGGDRARARIPIWYGPMSRGLRPDGYLYGEVPCLCLSQGSLNGEF